MQLGVSQHVGDMCPVWCCSSAEANKYTQQQLQLMKTQDVKYVTHKARVDAEVGNNTTHLH